MREAVWPRKGWHRGIGYYSHRIKRIPDTPQKIARGIAAGIFISFTPFLGLHLVLGIAAAWAMRGNILAGILATFFVNPVTLPFIAGTSFWTGRAVFGLGNGAADYRDLGRAFFDGFVGMWQVVGSWFGFGEAPWDKLLIFWTELLLPYAVGCIIPGVVFATGFYYLTIYAVSAYQRRRRARLHERARQRLNDKQRRVDLAT